MNLKFLSVCLSSPGDNWPRFFLTRYATRSTNTSIPVPAVKAICVPVSYTESPFPIGPYNSNYSSSLLLWIYVDKAFGF